MDLQDELRAAVHRTMAMPNPTQSDYGRVQDVLDRIARQYFENSMRRIRATKQ